jgi:DNA-binding response OmpR family regulator
MDKQPKIIIDKYEIEPGYPVIKMGNKEIILSPVETKIISVLALNKGRYLSHDQIEQYVYSHNYYNHNSRKVSVYIGYLRKKLGGHIIKTLRDFGYGIV